MLPELAEKSTNEPLLACSIHQWIGYPEIINCQTGNSCIALIRTVARGVVWPLFSLISCCSLFFRLKSGETGMQSFLQPSCSTKKTGIIVSGVEYLLHVAIIEKQNRNLLGLRTERGLCSCTIGNNYKEKHNFTLYTGTFRVI